MGRTKSAKISTQDDLMKASKRWSEIAMRPPQADIYLR